MEEGKKSKLVAVLLNALIMPGAGHIYIGYRLRGLVLAVATTFFVVLPLIKLYQAISFMSMAYYTVDAKVISTATRLFVETYPFIKTTLLLSVVGVGIIWIFGIVDVFVKTNRR